MILTKMTGFCRKKRKISVDFVSRYGYNDLYAGRKSAATCFFAHKVKEEEQ